MFRFLLTCFLFVTCVYTYQTKEQAAQLCRQVVSDSGSTLFFILVFCIIFMPVLGRGHILTLTDESVSPEFAGFPFGIMEYYSDKCTNNGNLILFMSDLQVFNQCTLFFSNQ